MKKHLHEMSGCIFFILWKSMFIVLPVLTAEVQEYCPGETFKPSCHKDEVIVMKQAMYGRMSMGRCVTIDIGYCASNVLAWMDKQCSGNRECEVNIPDFKLNQIISCKKELTPYLEASYICKPVYKSYVDSCKNSITIPLTSRPTTLSSRTSSTTGCGFPDYPWSLQAKTGQKINITMLDFHWSEEKKQLSGSKQQCAVKYGYIVDVETGEVVDVCGGQSRPRQLYVSHGNFVQIVLERQAVQQRLFLLEFQAIGCPDFIPPKNAWLSQEGQTITVGCHGSDEKWKLQCKDTTWLGQYGSCPEDPILMQVKTAEKKEGLPNVIALSLIGGITAVICCLAVTSITAYFCYRKYKHTEDADSTYYSTATAARGATSRHLMTLPGHPGHGTIVSVRSVRPPTTVPVSARPNTDTLTGQLIQTGGGTLAQGSNNMIEEVIYDDPANLDSSVQYVNQFSGLNTGGVGNSLQYTKLQRTNNMN